MNLIPASFSSKSLTSVDWGVELMLELLDNCVLSLSLSRGRPGGAPRPVVRLNGAVWALLLGKSRSIASSNAPDIWALGKHVCAGTPYALTPTSLDCSSLFGEEVGSRMSMGCA